jgi:hypothetical protein
VELVWHMARGARHEAPNSLAGTVLKCAGASRIEIDVRLLADDDALLCHDRRSATAARTRLEIDQVVREGLTLSQAALDRRCDGDAPGRSEGRAVAAAPSSVSSSCCPFSDRVVVGSMID